MTQPFLMFFQDFDNFFQRGMTNNLQKAYPHQTCHWLTHGHLFPKNSRWQQNIGELETHWCSCLRKFHTVSQVISNLQEITVRMTTNACVTDFSSEWGLTTSQTIWLELTEALSSFSVFSGVLKKALRLSRSCFLNCVNTRVLLFKFVQLTYSHLPQNSKLFQESSNSWENRLHDQAA